MWYGSIRMAKKVRKWDQIIASCSVHAFLLIANHHYFPVLASYSAHVFLFVTISLGLDYTFVFDCDGFADKHKKKQMI